jgi:hypothetical protein
MPLWLIKQLTRLAANALKNPETRKLGQQLAHEISGTRTRNKAIITASKITRANPRIGIFRDQLPLTSKETHAKVFWDTVRRKEMEQIKYPTKNITVRKGIMYNKKTEKANPIYFTGMKKTPMVDIDWEDPFSHHISQVVFKGPKQKARKEALNNLLDYVKADKGSKFRVYDTPAGMRIFNLSRRTRPDKVTHAIDKALGGDIRYRDMARGQGVFHSRLSPKPGRTPETGYPQGDFVARLLGDVGSGPIHPQNLLEVRKYHDDLIRVILNQTEKYGYPTSGGLFNLMKFIG